MYKNELSWIRIDSISSFTEVRKIGSRYEMHTYDAKILPDRNHLNDLLHNYAPFAVEIPAKTFEEVAVLTSK